MAKLKLSLLQETALIVVLWLPMAFFLWFVLASPLMFPVGEFVKWVLVAIFPETFASLVQHGFKFELDIYAATFDNRVALMSFKINPLIYAYGIPLLIGLIMASPISAWKRLIQIVIGTAIICLVVCWGVCFEALKTVMFELPVLEGASVIKPNLNHEFVILGYQLGYLILPAVIPIIFWVVSNRKIIEGFINK